MWDCIRPLRVFNEITKITGKQLRFHIVVVERVFECRAGYKLTLPLPAYLPERWAHTLCNYISTLVYIKVAILCFSSKATQCSWYYEYHNTVSPFFSIGSIRHTGIWTYVATSIVSVVCLYAVSTRCGYYLWLLVGLPCEWFWACVQRYHHASAVSWTINSNVNIRLQICMALGKFLWYVYLATS